jgi:GAF domain-containing protein
VVLEDARLLALPDLREQPSALPDYAQHALRGVVLVPLHKASENPLGLLVLGYRAPLSTFGSRATALSQGLARMVTVALSRTRHQQG